MACCQLITLPNPNYMKVGSHNWYNYLMEVPCGWCLNCRVDRRNWLSDAMTYEFKKFNFRGAFVTFTYDDIHLQSKSNILPDDFEIFRDDSGKLHKIPFCNNRVLNYSLDKNDPKLFLKRLRRKIQYYYNKHNVKPDSPVVELCNPNFKWFQTSEYGGIFQRPHIHFLFFGLDYGFCEDLFRDCWHEGFIDVKPIKDGAFEYVADYLIKQLHKEEAKQVYDDNGLVRPFSTHSLGLGKGIILDNLDYIKSHNGCYLSDSGQLRPIPIYYRNALHIRPRPDYSDTNNQMLQACIKPDLDFDQYYDIKTTTIKYSLRKMNDFRKDQALLRHKHLAKTMLNKGEAPPLLACDQHFETVDISEFVGVALSGSLQKWQDIKWVRANVPF